MKGFMKRAISLIVTVAMLISLLPAAWAVPASGASGVSVKYILGEGIATTDNIRMIESWPVTYEDTNGFWENAGQYPSGRGWYIKESHNFLNLSDVYHTFHGQDVIAFRIKVPIAGKYDLTMSYRTPTAGYHNTPIGAYILPGSISGIDNIKSALTASTKVGQVTTYDSTAACELTFGTASFDAPGEYILAIKGESTNTKDETRFAIFSFTLNGGSGIAPMGADVSLSKSSITLNETATIYTTNVWGSNATKYETGYNVEYTSETPDIVSVDPKTGVIHSLKRGEGRVKATVSIGEVSIDYVKKINVVTAGIDTKSGVKATINTHKYFAHRAELHDNGNDPAGYEDTHGFWELAERNPRVGSVSSWSGRGLDMYGTGSGNYYALRINVPYAGIYSMSVVQNKTPSSGLVGIYLIPGDAENIKSELSDSTRIYSGDWYQSANSAATPISLGEVQFPYAGEYYVVFRCEGEGAGGGYSIVAGDIVLDGGSEVAPWSLVLNAEKESIRVGESTTVSVASAYMSDDTAIDLKAATISYESLTPELASVSESGVITGIAEGTAKIRVGVTVSGKTASRIISVNVEKILLSGVKAVYDIKRNFPQYMWITGGNGSSAVTFADTDNTWAFEAVTDNRPVYIRSDFGYMAELLEGDWFALRLNVPAAGDYKLSVNRRLMANGGEVGIYFLPGTTTNIEASLAKENCINKFNWYNATNTSMEEVDVGFVSAPSAGEYILVMKGEKKGATGRVDIAGGEIILDGTGKLSATASKTTLGLNETATISAQAKRFDGTEIPASQVSFSYSSSDASVATVTDAGVIKGINDGVADITVSYEDSEAVAKAIIPIKVLDSSGVASAALTAPTTIHTRDNSKLVLTAKLGSGRETVIPASEITYSIVSGTPGAVSFAKDGTMTAKLAGTVTIKASSTFYGTEASATAVITVTDEGKKGPTIYTEEKVTAARENISKYDWARKFQSSAVTNAQNYINDIDTIYNSIASEGLPRSGRIGRLNDPERVQCHYCGSDLFGKYGGMTVLETGLWKAQCQDCKRSFPTNDFASLYKLGLNEKGEYSIERAEAENAKLVAAGEQGYMVNILYPELPGYAGTLSAGETKAGWGVDSGMGYDTGRKASNNVPVWHVYVAYINESYWINLPDKVAAFRDAYIYTGEKRYGIYGSMLLDRVADVFPDLDLLPYKAYYDNSHGGTGEGKFTGSIHDGTYVSSFVRSADAFYDVLEEPELIRFLNEKAESQGLANDKSSAYKIWKGWEDNFLKEVLPACENSSLYGNFPIHQEALVAAAVVLDDPVETPKMLEWAFRTGAWTPDTGVGGDGGGTNTGGNIFTQIIDAVDRDGFGNEASPMYNAGWPSGLLDIAEVLADYGKAGEYDLFSNAKFAKMLSAFSNIVLLDSYSPNIGDSTGTARRGIYGTTEGFKYLKDTPHGKALANFIYLKSGGNLENIHYDQFTENPESMKEDVLALVEEDYFRKSNITTGYGHVALKDGDYIAASGSEPAKNTKRNFHMYFGSNDGHGHIDMLTLSLDAFGVNFAPDLGYNLYTGKEPYRLQWVNSSISHNTVTVDNQAEHQEHPINTPPAGTLKRRNIDHGTPLRFDDAGKVKVMDADASNAFSKASVYRRTVVMVQAGDDVSYGIDFFRVKGGSKHAYSFHSQAETVRAISGLDMVPQVDSTGNYVGSFAGANVPYGKDPYSPDAWYYTTTYPRGYTWMTNVRRDSSPSSSFAVEFDVTDYRGSAAATGNENLHLRMTQFNNFTPNEVAFTAGEVPTYLYNEGVMPDTFDYVVVTREGTNLDSLFTTVFEPYQGSRYISSIEKANVTVKAGTPASSDVASAVRVTRTSGQVDYIVYATNSSVTYRVDDAFDFRGVVGVWSVDSTGSNIYRYVNGGDIIGESTGCVGVYTGKVASFTKSLSMENYIDVTLDNSDINVSELKGKLLCVDNGGPGLAGEEQNGSYYIEDATLLSANKVRLDIGTVTTVRKFADSSDFSRGYIFNIAEGQSVSIANSFSQEGDADYTVPVRVYAEARNDGERVNGAISGIDPSTWVSYDVGDTVSVSAAEEVGNLKFHCWKNADTNVVLSNEANYSFTAGSNIKLLAEYLPKPNDVETDTIKVMFYNPNGEFISEVTGIAKGTKLGDVPKPTPTMPGYTFKGWDYDVMTADTKLQTSQYIVATYTKNSIGNITVDGASEEYHFNDAVVANAPKTSGSNVFSHWTRDGETVSYSSAYTFYAWASTVVNSVYAATAMEKTPVAVMDDTPVEGAYMAEFEVPEGFERIEAGILFGNSAQTATLSLVAYHSKAISKATDAHGQFSAKPYDANDVCARSYIIYKDGSSVKLAYSDIIAIK